MRSRSLVTLIGLACLFSVTLTSAQVTFQLGAGGGARFPISDYGGTTEDYFSGAKYGLSTGYNVQAKARLGLVGLVVVGEIDYGTMTNSGSAVSGQGKVDVSHTLLAFKVGPEYQISIPAAPVTPYLGLNLAVNMLDGETKLQGISGIPTGTYSLESATRLGIGFNGGVVFSLGPAKLDVGLEYSLINPFSKEFTPVTGAGREDSYRFVNDEKDPSYAAGDYVHFISQARSINAFVVTVSVLFGL
jgi:hypothetical protein